MTVESNHVIAIATPSDWLKTHASFSTNEKQNQNQLHHVHVIFPRYFARNCDWFIALFAPVVIGRDNSFGFGFLTVI